MHIQRIAAAVQREYTLRLEGLHGVWHWIRVWRNGQRLAALTPGADLVVIELFALLHDSRRWDEDEDLEHGQRAAAFLRRLHGEGLLGLDASRLETLAAACAGHTVGRAHADPTIGCCWDADRLELARLGYPPDARYLSTAAALDPEIQRVAWDEGQQRFRDVDGLQRWGIRLPEA